MNSKSIDLVNYILGDNNLSDTRIQEEQFDILSQYVEIADNDDEILEKFVIETDGEDIVSAKSIRYSNIKFHLCKFLVEVVKFSPSVLAILTLEDSSRSAIGLVSLAIQFVEKISPLVEKELDAIDAQVMLVVSILSQERSQSSLNQVYKVLSDKFSEKQIAKSLDTLEKLSCITLVKHQIIIKDTISINDINRPIH
ncbi:MAG: hypothetical protein AAF702_30725 [Chloroflexota bacterium]